MIIKDLINNIDRFYPVLESLIKDKNIKQEWYEEIYKIFLIEDNEYTTSLKYQLFITLRNNPELIDFDLLSKTLKLSKDQIFYFIRNEAFEVYFPVYNLENKESSMAKAFIVEDTEKTFSFNSFANLETIESVSGKKFFVIFNKIFKGNSFQLAVLSGLIAKDKSILNNLSFTGEITTSGKILPVNHIKEKEKSAIENQKILITPDDVKDIKEIDFWLNNSEIPVILLNRNTDNNLKENLQQIETLIKQDYPYFNIKNLLKFYNLSEEDLYIITPSVNFSNTEEILNLLKQFEEKLEKLFSVKSAILYLSLSIASLGFLVGALIGARKKTVILHYQGGYYKAIDMSKDPRVIKQNVSEYKVIQFQDCNTDKEDKEEVALILNIASHNPIGHSKSYIEKNLPQIKSICVISTIYSGNIPLEEFLTISRELYTYINTIKEKIHLFYSIPVPIAISLGMAIAHFKDITLYHFDSKKSEYTKIPVNLKEVVSKF
jgi:hypothetical protein